MPGREWRMGPIDRGMQMKLLWLTLLAPLMAGCVTTGGGSVAGGECKVFEAPAYAIRGATQRDQDWIDPTIESGIGGCHWARPAPRPAEWDAVAKPKVAKKRPTLVKRIKAKVWPDTAAPVVEVPTVEQAPEPAPAAPIPPRSVLDRLLHPSVAP